MNRAWLSRNRSGRPRPWGAGMLIGLGLALGPLSACSSGSDPAAGNNLPVAPPASGSAAASGKIGIVAAENTWGNIASQIGGDRVSVRSIISDPNVDPHAYEMDASSAAATAGAGFVIENGLGYDDFVGKLLKASPKRDREVVNIAGIVGAHGGDANPHLWYEPGYVVEAAQAIEARLATEDPVHAASYQANLERFLSGEQQVVSVVEEIKAKYAGAPVAYTERVPGYLVEAAGLRLGTPASFSRAIEDGTDPSPGDNAAFQLALQDHGVKVLLYNAQVSSPVTAKIKSLATKNGIPVIGVTETLPPGEKDFQTWQRAQAEALLTALGG